MLKRDKGNVSIVRTVPVEDSPAGMVMTHDGSRLPVGTAPVGVGVIEDGRKVVVTNSNRFAGGADDRQTLVVLNASRLAAGAAAILGSIPAGGFPREIRLTTDRLTLLLTNFTSRTLELIDLQRVPLQPVGR